MTVLHHSNSSFLASAIDFRVVSITELFAEGAVNSLLLKAAGGTFAYVHGRGTMDLEIVENDMSELITITPQSTPSPSCDKLDN